MSLYILTSPIIPGVSAAAEKPPEGCDSKSLWPFCHEGPREGPSARQNCTTSAGVGWSPGYGDCGRRFSLNYFYVCFIME